AEGTVLVIAAAGKLDGENGLGCEVLAERKAVKVRRRQRIDVFGKERLVDDSLPVLPVDEIRHLAEIALPLQLMDELQQGSLPFKDHKVIGKLEHRLDPPEVVHQPGED